MIEELKAPCTRPHPRFLIRPAPEWGIAAVWGHARPSGLKRIFLPASPQFAAARREDVLHPLRSAAACESDDEAVRRTKDVYGGTVDLAGLSSDVGQNAEAGKPACEQPGDPVRKGNVDLRQPSLTEPHHEHARGGDSDDCDGCGIHGSLGSNCRPAPSQQRLAPLTSLPEPERPELCRSPRTQPTRSVLCERSC